jgi:hypothetical protein
MVNPQWTSTPIKASQSVIRFDHPDFDPKLADYLVRRQPRAGHAVSVARFAGDRAFAVEVAMKTGPGCQAGSGRDPHERAALHRKCPLTEFDELASCQATGQVAGSVRRSDSTGAGKLERAIHPRISRLRAAAGSRNLEIG